ncbi:MAG: histidine kinase [Chitinophagaceae bacterium]|nr:histidine kinase [Chitinophagaceae bacterium]
MPTRQRSLLFLLFFFQGISLFAQNVCNCPEIEELKNAKQKNEPGFARLAKGFQENNDNNVCKARFFEWKAEEFIKTNNYDSARYFLDQSLIILKSLSCNDKIMLNYYRIMAELNHTTGEYQRSLDNGLKMLSIAESHNMAYEEALSRLIIGVTFDRMKQSATGIRYARESVPLISQIEPPFEKAEILSRIAARYYWYFQDTRSKTLLDSAELFTNEQLKIARQVNDTGLIRNAFMRMNSYCHARKDYRGSIKYIDSSLQLHSNKTNYSQIATLFSDKANNLMELKKYVEAKQFADSGLYFQQKVKNPETIANAYALIYEIGNQSKDYAYALKGLEGYIEITDSLSKLEKTKAINELEKKYNQAKNEKTIKELAQQKRIYLLLALAGLMGIVIIGFYIRQQTLKHKQKVLETEQRLNRARMNPHFFFNALASLQAFALRGNDGKAIAANLSRFSHIMRETLESTYKEYVTIEQEIDFLNEYLALQQIRFPDTFLFNVKADANLDINEFMIPSMIIQPFAENSIEHGFRDISYKGEVNILFYKESEEIVVALTDNGKGFPDMAETDNKHTSRASQIIRDRIYLLNIKLKTKARFSIDNNPDGKGVHVLIHLPIIPA